jgi:ATP-dependent exoDNAse (exonuclease V) beta subunit
LDSEFHGAADAGGNRRRHAQLGGAQVVSAILRLPNSGLPRLDSAAVSLAELHESPRSRSRLPLIRYATVHAFKGLESPVVILC